MNIDEQNRQSRLRKAKAELEEWRDKERAAQERSWRASNDVTATWHPQKLLEAEIAELEARVGV